jgi:hypothetical protein
MKTIDRLIIKASKAYGLTGKEISVAIISLMDNGKWQAQAQIWTGKAGSGETLYKECDTLEDAESYINELADAYPPKDDIPVIIDDIRE